MKWQPQERSYMTLNLTNFHIHVFEGSCNLD
jgi:hypothetical protein